MNKLLQIEVLVEVVRSYAAHERDLLDRREALIDVRGLEARRPARHRGRRRQVGVVLAELLQLVGPEQLAV